MTDPIKEFVLDGDSVFVLTTSGRLMYTELNLGDEIEWYDITPTDKTIVVFGEGEEEQAPGAPEPEPEDAPQFP